MLAQNRRKPDREGGRRSDNGRDDERPAVSHHPSRCVPPTPSLTVGLLPQILYPASLLLESLNLTPDQLALERRGAVEEDDAVAVVGLVEHAARFEVEAVELKLLALQVLRADDGAQAALDLKKDAGEREASLVVRLLALDAQDDGVDECDARLRVTAAR